MLEIEKTSPEIQALINKIIESDNNSGWYQELLLYYLKNTFQNAHILFDEIKDILNNKNIDIMLKWFLITKCLNVPEHIRRSINSDLVSFISEKPSVWKEISKWMIGNDVIDPHLLGKIHNIPLWEKTKFLWEKVNRHQVDGIISNWSHNLPIPTKRSLVLYCRPFQWYYEPHFWFILQIIKRYVQDWHSQIWNDVKVLFRSHNQEGGRLRWDEYSWVHFRQHSSIFADTIHLSHGTPEEIPWTHSILGTAIMSDPGKQELLQKVSYTPLDLLYYGWENKEIVQQNTWDNWLW